MHPDDPLQYVDLYRKRFVLGMAEYPEFRGQAKYDVEPDITGMLIHKVMVDVLSEDLETQTVTFPIDWWEAVKQRWAPAWYTDRWPVRTKTVTMEAFAIYPRVSLPEYAPGVRILKRESLPF